MKYIITESQLNNVLPIVIKRRLAEMDDALYEMMYNSDIGTDDVKDYDREDYIDYVIELLFADQFLYWASQSSNEEIENSVDILKKMFEEKIGDFWDNYHDEKDSINESVDNLKRKIKIVKKYTEDELSEKDWFNGLDIRVSSYQTAHTDSDGRHKMVSIPYLVFEIDTKGIPKSFSYNDMIKLDNEVIDVVDPIFTSIFPYDKNNNPQVVWETNFDLHL